MGILALCMTVAVVLITLAASFEVGDRAFALFHRVPGRDLTGHFVLFGLLSLSVTSWMCRRTPKASGWTHIRVTALLAVLILIEEISQGFIPARTFSLLDLSASLTGLLAGSLASLWLLGT